MYVYHLISQWKMGYIIVSLLCKFVLFVLVEIETTQSFSWLDGQSSTLDLKERVMQDYLTRYSGGGKHWRFGKQKGSIFVEKFDEQSRKRSLVSDNQKFWFWVQIYTNQGDFRVIKARTLDETWYAGVLGVLRLNLEGFLVFPYLIFLYISPISNCVLRMEV